MKIVLINGSPKMGDSASGSLLTDLKNCSKDFEGHEIAELGLHTAAVPTDMAEALVNANAIVFACPLYVDGIPGHLLSCLTVLERQSQTFLWQTSLWQGHKPLIYGIVNCGFYEGVQAQYALDVLRNWAAKSGCTWGGGIGVGGGGGLTQMPTVKGGHGPKAPVEKALAAMADIISKGKTQENLYVSVAFPRFLYKMAAQRGWRQMIKANGGNTKDLGKCP